jgi:mRNA-degrading endonuclease toxin of MazEF toxin-antitoxin module
VISHDAFNQTQNWRSNIVVRFPLQWRKPGAGLRLCCCHKGQPVSAKTVLLFCHQVTTLDRSKLTQRIGELNSTELSQVEDGLKAAMDLL